MSKYKVPDSTEQEDVPVQSLFTTHRGAKLDESVRNFGALTSECATSGESTRSEQCFEVRDTTPHQPTTAQEPITATHHPATTDQQTTTHHPVTTYDEPADVLDKERPTKPKTFAETFSFIKNTEFYNNTELTEREEESKKRKAEEIPPNEPVVEKVTRITVSTRQRGNPLLSHIRNVPLSYSSTLIPDYVMGSSSCALFLSLKYHRLHNEYIYERLRHLGKGYIVRILLLLIDVPDSAVSIKELTKAALLSDCTLLLAWSSKEAARYLEAFKIYEHKPAEALQGRVDESKAETHFITSIRGVNKSDVMRLKREFGTIKKIVTGSVEELSACHGIGDKKAQRIHDIFRAPFKSKHKSS